MSKTTIEDVLKKHFDKLIKENPDDNWQLAGFATLDAFIAAMHIDEDQHLHAFVNFVKNKNLVDELQRKDWAGFALGYNGSGYKQNKYDEKLAAAYFKFKGSL